MKNTKFILIGLREENLPNMTSVFFLFLNDVSTELYRVVSSPHLLSSNYNELYNKRSMYI